MVALPEALSFTAGAAISCGSGTALWRAPAPERLRPGHDRHLRPGPVGLAGTQFAKAMGARVIALDTNPQRLERAREFGADELVNPGSNDPVAAIKELTAGKYADLTLDTSSNREAAFNAIRSTKVGALCASLAKAGTSRSTSARTLLRRQMTLIASWTFSTIIQAECAAFCVERKIDVDKLFTHR